MATWNLVSVHQCVHRHILRPLRRVATKAPLPRKPQMLVAVKEFRIESIMSAIYVTTIVNTEAVQTQVCDLCVMINSSLFYCCFE
jgi:hypothetical protein